MLPTHVISARTRVRDPRAPRGCWLLSVWALAAGGCGTTTYTKRMVETPAGYSQTLGPARNTAYLAKVSMEHNIAHITVYERSECQVFKLRLVDRVEETVDDDDEVVQREAKGQLKIPEGEQGVQPCEERFARVPVSLGIGGNTYPLGDTSPTGALDVDLASVVRPSTRGVDLSAERGMLMVAGRIVGEVPLAGLAQHQQRLEAIIAELTPLLSKPAAKLSDADVTRVYTLYEQMRELSTDDARVVGLQRRFVEVMSGMKEIAKAESLKRNMAALAEAKDLLKNLPGVVPSYVQMSISSDQVNQDAIAWAQAVALVAFREQPGLCAGGFDWTRAAGTTGTDRLAFTYLRYAGGDGYTNWLGSVCKR